MSCQIRVFQKQISNDNQKAVIREPTKPRLVTLFHVLCATNEHVLFWYLGFKLRPINFNWRLKPELQPESLTSNNII